MGTRRVGEWQEEAFHNVSYVLNNESALPVLNIHIKMKKIKKSSLISIQKLQVKI